MSKLKVVLNSKGVRELLKSSEMKAIISEHAQATANNAGSDYETDTKYMSTRVIASVYTTRQKSDYNELLRALE